MRIKYVLVISAILMLLLVSLASAAPPPPVPQVLGKKDTIFTNITATECRECHGGQPTALVKYPANNIHHNMIGRHTTTLGCDDCHTNEVNETDGTLYRYIEPNCLNCHNGTGWYKNPVINLTIIRGKPGRPHHNTSKNSSTNFAVPAKDMAASRNCRGCHSEFLLDNYNDGHQVRNLSPQLVSVMADYKINRTIGGGLEWGGCKACHDVSAANPIINDNEENHHFDVLQATKGAQCNYCHVASGTRAEPNPDFSPEPSANIYRVWFNDSSSPYYQYYLPFDPDNGMYGYSWDSGKRHFEVSNWTMLSAGDTINGTGCLKCHSYRDLHTIEATAPGYNNSRETIDAKIPGYGHVGNDTDCDGCHAGWAPASEPPVTGQALSASVVSITPASIVTGTDADVTLSGQNYVQANFTTDVMLDGAPISTKSITDNQIVATVPGATAPGAHSLVVNIGGTNTEIKMLYVTTNMNIVSAELSSGTLTIKGSGFGVQSDASSVSIEKDNGIKFADGITSWTDTEIVATSAAAAVGDKVIVQNIDGIATAVITSGYTPTLTTITLEPATANVKIGNTQVFTATAKDQSGQPMQGISISFTGSNTRVGTVSPASANTNADGIATTTFTAKSRGTAIVTAASGTVSDTSTVTVTNR